jgi:hypothetical protein
MDKVNHWWFIYTHVSKEMYVFRQPACNCKNGSKRRPCIWKNDNCKSVWKNLPQHCAMTNARLDLVFVA